MKSLSFAVVVLTASVALAADPSKESVYTPASELKWEQPMGAQGPSVAVVNGDPTKGPMAEYMKFPAGFDSGWHTHDDWYEATVVKGTMTAQGQGDATAKTLPTGSYFGEPGKKN